MTHHPILVADVGGTNTRFALADHEGLIEGSAKRYPNEGVDRFVDVAKTFMATLDGVNPTRFCIAIAGPVTGGQGKLTNGDWVFDTDALSCELGIEKTYLLNDLAALGHALEVLPDHMVTQIGGVKPTGSQALVAGIATGFNVSMSSDGNVVEAELGHASLPTSVTDVLKDTIGEKAAKFRKNEALFSGDGLAALHIALGFDAAEPAEITRQAGKTVAVFAQALGVFCRELTYQYLPLGGLYFNGSVARAIVGSPVATKIIATEAAKHDTFAERFAQVPLYLITEDNAALYGCAHFAKTRA